MPMNMNPEMLADLTLLLIFLTVVCGALVVAGVLAAILEKVLRPRA